MLFLSTIAAAMVSTGPLFLVEEAISYQNLRIFPVVRTVREAPNRQLDYLTLDEGLKSGQVVITEKGQVPPGGIIRPPREASTQQPQQAAQNVQNRGGDTVNELFLVNKSKKKLLLLAGELIIGGNQDRVIAKDMIVLPNREPVSLSVFCVEHGRWSKQTDTFGGLGGVAHPELRKNAQHDNDQQRVWGEVAKNTDALKAGSSTGRYQEVYNERNVGAELKPYLDAYAKFPKNACGAVVSFNGRLVWLDAFATPEIFAKYWPKLLKSYVIGAAAEKSTPHNKIHLSKEMAQSFLDDRTGKTSFEGVEDVFRFTKISGQKFARYELEDLTFAQPVLIHLSRMPTGK